MDFGEAKQAYKPCSSQTTYARELRQRQTDAERTLWAQLRNRQVKDAKFRRQQPIGPYIVDFVSFENKLVIEIDGGHHNEDAISSKDEKRTIWLRDEGFHVLRFWNNEVLTNTDGVIERISEAISPSL